MLSKLSEDLVLFLLEFVNYDEKVEFVSCCKKWYQSWMVKYIRHFTFSIRENNNGKFEHSIEAVKRLISNPFNQITLYFNQVLLQNLPFYSLRAVNHELFELKCNQSEFIGIMRATERLRVKQLIILQNNHIPDSALQESFAKVVDCETLQLPSPFIPSIPSLKTLKLKHTAFNTNSLLKLVHALKHLCLYCCSISDVSMLGSIPSLEIMFCQQVVDISSLNHNKKVKIEYCDQIRDYSQSFRNSARIQILLRETEGVFRFDLSRWKIVEHLSLLGSHKTVITFTNECNRIPHTVKRCYLRGNFVTFIDFTVTANHAIQEIKLAENNSITSLEGYGLERIPFIKCHIMQALQSLKGLGFGKNQKITISYCDKITDFSPIGHLPIVKITDCYGFTDPLQVRLVYELSIAPMRLMSFQSDLTVIPNPFAHIHSLTLRNTKHLTSFDGLEKIPILVFDWSCMQLITRFLETGKQLENEKLVVDGIFQYVSSQAGWYVQQRYLQHQYYYYPRNVYNRWVWIRKDLVK